MKALELSKTAQRDLAEVDRYFEREAPHSAQHVRNDIEAVFNLLRSHPHLGTQLKRNGLSRTASTRYRFVIYHRLVDDTVYIEAVFRHQDR